MELDYNLDLYNITNTSHSKGKINMMYQTYNKESLLVVLTISLAIVITIKL